MLSAKTLPAINQWTSIGPEGGVVNALVVDSANPSVLYAGTSAGGVYKSVDGAATWLSANVGLLPGYPSGSAADVLALVQDPSHPATLYAGTRRGIFKTVNGAATWYRQFPVSSSDLLVAAIAVLPGNPFRVIALTTPGTVFGLLDGELFSGGVKVFKAAFDVRSDSREGTLFVGTDAGVARSRDGGATWSTPTGPQDVRSIAVDPSDSTLVYAGSGSGELFRSSDSGQTWSPTAAMIFPASIRLIRVDPANGRRLFAGTLQSGFQSSDGGATWRPLALGGVGLSDVAFDPATPQRLYAATIGRGVFRSLDSGASWTASNVGLTCIPVVSLRTDPRVPSTIYAGASPAFDVFKGQPRFPGGLYRSDDAGASWSFSPIADGFDPQFLAIDSGSPFTLYVGGNGFFTTNGLYRSVDSGSTWTELTSLPGPGFGSRPEVTSIAAIPGRPGALYVTTGPFAGGNGGLFRSLDSGDSWQRLYPGSAGPIAVDLSAPATFYLGLHSSGFGILKSTDGGLTFQSAVERPATVTDFQIAPTDPTTVYATQINESDSPQFYGEPSLGNLFGIFKSSDGGLHWAKGVQPETLSGPLLSNGSIPGTIFAGGYGQVSRSTDGGATWSSLGFGLEGRRVTSLAVDPTNAATLYAATSSAGVFRYAIADPVTQCVSSATQLCLHRGRFEVRAFSQLPAQTRAPAPAVPLGDDAGEFSFFSPGNPELVVKIVDGAAVNGKVWIFVGPTSNVLYAVEILDRQTGVKKAYINPGGTLASIADTGSFPADAGGGDPPRPSADFAQASEGASPCGAIAGSTCLYLNRFRVDVRWRTTEGTEGIGRAAPLSSFASAFWFFNPNSPEYLVKVLDARPINGHFWVFLGSLTNVETTITVTDSQTGVARTYFSRAGEMTSLVDSGAF